jgi:hypothetical protein
MPRKFDAWNCDLTTTPIGAARFVTKEIMPNNKIIMIIGSA